MFTGLTSTCICSTASAPTNICYSSSSLSNLYVLLSHRCSSNSNSRSTSSNNKSIASVLPGLPITGRRNIDAVSRRVFDIDLAKYVSANGHSIESFPRRKLGTFYHRYHNLHLKSFGRIGHMDFISSSFDNHFNINNNSANPVATASPIKVNVAPVVKTIPNNRGRNVKHANVTSQSTKYTISGKNNLSFDNVVLPKGFIISNFTINGSVPNK